MKYSKPKPRSAMRRAWFGALLALTSCTSGLAADAPPATAVVAAPAPVPGKSLAGSWLGGLNVNAGMALRLALDVTQTDGKLAAILDSIDQNAKVPVTTIAVNASEVQFECASIAGSFEGSLSADGAEIVGTWSQGGASLPLTFKRQSQPFVLKRPQQPAKPYPYREEELTFRGPAADITLAGTLTLPDGKGPFPAVVLMSGSGPQDRDEALMGHKPFLVLADQLTRAGIAVLRYDDRGVGKSTGDFSAATHLDFAADGRAAFEYLKSRPEIDPKKVGLLGHSEGSVYVPFVMRESKDVAFVVMLAGIGVPVRDLLDRQARDIASASGVKYEKTPALQAIDNEIYARLASGKSDAELQDFVRGKLKEATALYPEDLKKAMGWSDAMLEGYVRMTVSPWFMLLSQYDPRETLPAVKCPVLALFGSKDTQVAAAANSAGMRAAFDAGGNRDVTLKTFPDLNHLFQHAKTGAPAEYGSIEETMSPEVTDMISKWIKERT
jgi:pimeloyl-ACP methyl ester carboxylesterase